MSNEYNGPKGFKVPKSLKVGMETRPKVFQVLEALALGEARTVAIYHDSRDGFVVALLGNMVWQCIP